VFLTATPNVYERANNALASTRLIGDIGGTNARFGWQSSASQPIEFIETYRCADFPSIDEAIAFYLGKHSFVDPSAFVLGVATPVNGDLIQFTNSHWSFSVDTLKKRFHAAHGIVINDFLALASIIPILRASDVEKLNSANPLKHAPVALIGPGTGLGVACLFADHAGTYRASPGEGGHVTLAAANDDEAALIAVLRAKFGHVSAERAVSGPGLVEIYLALAELRGVNAEALTPAQVTERAIAASDPLCVAALEQFTDFLGSVAGNLALTVGAFGGVYLGGGIVPTLGAHFDHERFLRAFENKGRFGDYLQRVPVSVITCDMPGLRGAAHYLDQVLSER
jgi:glucokinase